MNLEDPDSSEVARVPLKTIGLRTGMALQTRRLVAGATKKESQYFGAIEGKGVMVGPMGSDAVQTGLEAGEVCVVRGFTGQFEFSFVSKVLQTFEKPFAYALLAYPATVDARLVRQSLRTRTSWPSTVVVPARQAGSPPHLVEVTLVDVSVAGAMVRSPGQLASIGETLTLTLSANVDEAAIKLSVAATICHNNKSSTEDVYFVGMSFRNLSPQDKLILTYLTQNPNA
jgi:c-di-GMP-binding flagellar brake protein YcgR